MRGCKRVAVLEVNTPRPVLREVKKIWEDCKGETTFLRFLIAHNNRLTTEELQYLCSCDAIFIGGGDTRLYHKAFAKGSARKAILAAWGNGARLGGISAGVLLFPQRGTIWGSCINEHGKKILLNSTEANAGANSQLKFERGLGVTNLVLDVHCTSWGRLPRILEAVRRLRVKQGLCIDENVLLVIDKDGRCQKFGSGRAYLISNDVEQRISILRNGQTV